MEGKKIGKKENMNNNVFSIVWLEEKNKKKREKKIDLYRQIF